jgi:hypothetical protein
VALLYAAFFGYTTSLLLRPGSGQTSASGSRAQETELTARVLSRPYGQLLVGTVGAVLLGAGLGFGYQAVTTNFQERLKRERMRPALWRVATVLGAVGSWARAVVLVLVGVFVIAAAVTFDPRKARGLDASLRTLAGQPYGPYLLGAIALGLVCYGGVCAAGDHVPQGLSSSRLATGRAHEPAQPGVRLVAMAAIPARAALASGLPLHPLRRPTGHQPTAKELAEQPRLLVQAGQQLGQHAWCCSCSLRAWRSPGTSIPCCWARCCRSWPNWALLRVHAGDGVLSGLLVNVGGGIGGDLLERPIASSLEMPS